VSRTLLREVTLEDAETLYRMQGDLSVAVGEGALFEASLEAVRRDAFGPGRRYECRLAEIDAVPAGMLTFFMTYSTYKGAPCLFIDNLFVEPWARGQALAAKLMAEAARIALARGCCRIDLHVLKDNPACAFYASIGMTATDERPYTIARSDLARLAEEK